MRKPLALIFEDEPMIVVDIEASLKQAGFAVASEPSCVRARQILALVEPDVVIWTCSCATASALRLLKNSWPAISSL